MAAERACCRGPREAAGRQESPHGTKGVVPSPHGSLIEALLYGQAPYLFTGEKALSASELARRKVLIGLHEDVGFAEMTGHELLSPDGSRQRSTFAGGLTVEADKDAGRYRISDGRAKTRGWRKL